jgi:integrase
MGKHNGLPDRMIVVRWKVRDGFRKFYAYNNQSGRAKDAPRSKIKLSENRAEAMRMYAEIEGKELPEEMQTVSAAWEFFETHPRGLEYLREPRTQKDYRMSWKLLAPVFGACMWQEISRVDAVKYLDNRKSKGQGNKEIKLLSLLWDFALNRGLTRTANPLLRMEYNRLKPRDRYITDGEYKAIMLAGDVVLRDAMQLAYLTGQRPSDVLRLTWRDVTERDGKIFVLCEQAKTKKSVEVEAKADLVAFLDVLCNRPVAAIKLIITPTGRPVSLGMIQDRFKPAAKAAGVKDAHFADLRAKSASDEQGGATERLGHATEAITKRIYRRFPGSAKSAR